MSMTDYRINPKNGLEFGLYSLGDHMPDALTGERVSAEERVNQIIQEAKLAEDAGLDFFSIGESHQQYFVGQAHAVLLGAVAQATSKIKLGSAATIVSTSDPVRIYENFATIDLLSNGRAEIIGGRASRLGLFELLGYNVSDYEELFEEKFELLLKINQEKRITWQGNFRAPLHDAEILPRPLNDKLPIWRAVGGPAESAIKAGMQGVPMAIAMLGGPVAIFKRSVDAYRQSLRLSGYQPTDFPVATTGLFYAAADTKTALREFYPYVDKGITLANGTGFNKRLFANGAKIQDVMAIGSPQAIIEKILYQYEQFGHQRYMAQIDFGGLPFEKVMKNIEIIGKDILPAIKKYTRKWLKWKL